MNANETVSGAKIEHAEIIPNQLTRNTGFDEMCDIMKSKKKRSEFARKEETVLNDVK